MIDISIAMEFFCAGEDSFKKKRYNAATDAYFKAIVTLCDAIIKSKNGIIPKNHTERFDILKIYYPYQFNIISDLFSRYRKTYNQKADVDDAHVTKEKFIEIKKLFGIENSI